MCSLSEIFMIFSNNYPKIDLKFVGYFFFLSRVQSRIIRILQLLKGWGVHFVYYASYASLFAMKLEKLRVNEKTTA